MILMIDLLTIFFQYGDYLTTSLTMPTATVNLSFCITIRPKAGYVENVSMTIGRSGTSSTIAESPGTKYSGSSYVTSPVFLLTFAIIC